MTERAPGTTDDRAVEQPGTSQDIPGTPVAAGPPPGALGAGPPPEPEHAPEQQPEVQGLDRRRGLGAVLGSTAFAWAVALIALAAAVFAGMQWADLYAAEQARAEVRSDATKVALRLTTFDGAEIEEWYAQTLETATGEYGEQLRQVFDQETRQQLRDIEAVSRGEIENLFVQEVDGDEASAFAVVTQTYANASTAEPVEDHLRMDIRLERVDGEWLASEVAVLGPAGVVAPTPAGEGGQAPTTPAEPGNGGDQ